MDKNSSMKRVAEKVGRERAIALVMEAYNTELLTTWISRIEASKPIGGPQRRDHLGDALERVMTVCNLLP